MSTVCASDQAIPAPSTATSAPASSVETLVIATDSATSPLARYAITFEEVPPGTEPSMSSPTASAGLRPRSLATATAPSGMITNCATTPMAIGTGRFATP